MRLRLSLSIALGICAGGTAIADIRSGLIAEYRFEGNALDSSGSNLHGVAQGGVGYSAGRVGLAAEFDGVDDVVVVQHGGALTFDLDTQSYTISAWFMIPTFVGTTEPTILQDRWGSNHSTSYGIGFNVSASPKYLYAASYYGEATGSNIVNRTVADGLLGAWHHVALTFDHNLPSEQQVLYLDGVAASSGSRPNEQFTPGPGNTLTIGSYWAASGMLANWFKGKLDEVRIYNRALSPAEVLVLAGVPSSCTTSFHESFESDAPGAAASGWEVRFPGGGHQVVTSPIIEGNHALKMTGLPFSAIELKSTTILTARHGIAHLSFKIRHSSESTAQAPDCSDVLVQYLGDMGSVSMGFQRDLNGGAQAPMRIVGVGDIVVPDRWYSFHGTLDFDRGTVSWTIDGVHRVCVPMGAPTTDSTRVNRLSLHTGCIDDGTSVAYFDEISFVSQPGCSAADYTANGSLTVEDIFQFLAGYFSGCP